MKTNLVFIMGPACVGKTTLGRKLASELHYMFVDSDTFSRHYTTELSKLHGLDEKDRDSDEYLQKIKPIEAKVTYALVAENLKLGISVIVPTVLFSQSKQENWVHLFLNENQINDVNVKVIQLFNSSEESMKNRILTRGHPQDGWKTEHWESYYPSIQHYDVTWKNVKKLVYDNTHLTSLKDMEQFKHFILMS